MPPKMRKRWMHRKLEAMREAGPSDREVEDDGLVGLVTRLEGTSRLDTQHLMTPWVGLGSSGENLTFSRDGASS